MPRPILYTFLEWLEGRGVQVICYSDPGQPPPIGGEMPHDLLRGKADYYDEVATDYGAEDRGLTELKKGIHLQPDRVQCWAMRKALPWCLGYDRFVEAWKLGNLILTSRQKVRNRAQEWLFRSHKDQYSVEPVPLLYHTRDTRKQNIMITILGPVVREWYDVRLERREELVLNDIVEVPDMELLSAFQPKDTKKFSVDRLDNTKGYPQEKGGIVSKETVCCVGGKVKH